MYPGDTSMRTMAQWPAKRRGPKRRKDYPVRDEDGTFRPSYEHYLDAKRPRGRGVKTRLCLDDIGLLKEHINSFVTCGAGTCVVCGQRYFGK